MTLPVFNKTLECDGYGSIARSTLLSSLPRYGLKAFLAQPLFLEDEVPTNSYHDAPKECNYVKRSPSLSSTNIPP